MYKHYKLNEIAPKNLMRNNISPTDSKDKANYL